MNFTEAQARVDALAKRLQEKGVKNAQVDLDIRSGAAMPRLWLKGENLPGKYTDGLHGCRGNTLTEMFAAADAFIDIMPSAEEIAQRAFLRQLGELIDKGRDLGIALDFINPLSETMRRLSENVITDRSKEDAE